MLESIGRIARNGHLTIPSKIRKILNIEDTVLTQLKGISMSQLMKD